MAAEIVATDVAHVINHARFSGYQLAGTLLLVGGLVRRMRGDAVFAALRLQGLEAEQRNDGIEHAER